ncbi:MAG: hypothetical protein P8L29_03605 [Burkholderiales bacterium]|nr:hypothetical protein [Burkholderiales bacterium]
MTSKLYVPRDSSAVAMGADLVADKISQVVTATKADVEVVRNGSRGMMWMEPLLEVETASGRMGYANVTVDDVENFALSGFSESSLAGKGIGLVSEHPYLKNQERLCFARNGITDPTSIDDYIAHDGFKGLEAALALDGKSIVEIVTKSGLRGRGGGSFSNWH